jgi:hypothetical protein
MLITHISVHALMIKKDSRAKCEDLVISSIFYHQPRRLQLPQFREGERERKFSQSRELTPKTLSNLFIESEHVMMIMGMKTGETQLNPT